MTEPIPAGLSALKFKSSADATTKNAAADGDGNAFRKQLQKSLSPARKRFEKQFSDVPFVAAWSAGAIRESADRELLDVLQRLNAEGPTGKGKKSRSPDVAPAVAAVAERIKEPSGLTAFAIIVAAEALLRYIKQFSADDAALTYCALAEFVWPDDRATSEPMTSGASSELIRQVEAPLICGLLLGNLQGSRALVSAASREAAAAIDAATDTDGTLRADLARQASTWLAPFTRLSGWASAFDTPWAGRKTLERWDGILEQTALLAIPGGLLSKLPSDSDAAAQSDDHSIQILRHAGDLAGFSSTSRVMSLLSPAGSGGNRKKKADKKQKQKQKHVRLSDQSDWAETAVFRNTTHRDADVISLMWDQMLPILSFAALGQPVVEGTWDYSILVDGSEVTRSGEWVCTCWFDDREVAFAELESGSENGVRHVRHVMMSLQDHFAVITDSVTSPEPDSEIEFSSVLPVRPDMTAQSHSITRELQLNSACHSVRVVPAWLDDDRIQQALGALEFKDGQLQMSARNAGGVTVPLVLDWHPERQALDADWSPLTVTEDRRVATGHEATGYRVRIGGLQLLLYRSLRNGETLRAVLGHHTANETVYGRVRKSGNIAPLVMVDSEA